MNWPPYNIERTSEDDYRITMAVAGFSPDEIEMTQHQNALLVSGQKKTSEDELSGPASRHRHPLLQADLQPR
jgi:HSP20 family molecular chaperone IbpA